MLRALRAEVLKLKRSRIPLWTALAVCVMPLLSVMVAKLTDGELAHTTYEAFMLAGPEMLASATAVLLFGLCAAYLFTREHEEGTLRNALTLPLRREWLVAAKMIVLAVWVALLTLLSVAVQAAYAAFLGLDGFAWAHVALATTRSLEVALVVYMTLPVVVLLAILGKGYLPPMLFSAVALSAGITFAVVGWERWFPWSMPMVFSGMTFAAKHGPNGQLGAGSWAVLAAMFAVGLAVVMFYVDRADNVQ